MIITITYYVTRYLLFIYSSSIEPSSQQQQQDSEENMHTSLPSMVRGYAATTDYTVNWSMNSIENREIDVQDLSERRIKVLLLVYFLHDYAYFLCVTKICFNMLRFWFEILILFSSFLRSLLPLHLDMFPMIIFKIPLEMGSFALIHSESIHQKTWNFYPFYLVA